MTVPFSRRKFILTGAVGSGALVAGSMSLWPRGGPESVTALPQETTPVISRKNGSVNLMLSESLDYLAKLIGLGVGGMANFISPGDKVAIKVNGSWNNPLANTDPEVVKEVVLAARNAGASEVIVFDHLIQQSGWASIADAAESAGAQTLKIGSSGNDYVDKPLNGVRMKSMMVAKVLDEVDVLINVPKLKTHSQGEVTIALKNHVGTVQDRGLIHRGGGMGLHQGIADLNTCPDIITKQRLIVCDAIDPMVTGGPGQGTYSNYRGIIVGVDPVATDYIGTQVIRRYNSGVPETPKHVSKSAALGLGTDQPGLIDLHEDDVGAPIPELPLEGVTVGFALLALAAGKTLGSRGSGVNRDSVAD